jgi:acetylglutamate kinase
MVAAAVVKLGGRAFDETRALRRFAAEVAASSEPLVLVHGGGADVSAWCEKQGIAPRFSDGLRVTDDATLEVAVAVLAGLANKRLVAALRAVGVDAVGIAALDGGCVDVVPHPRADVLGRVGEVRAVDPSLLRDLLAGGRTPVVSSLGAHEGQLLNLNADDVAAALAAALSAPALLLLGDAQALVLGGEAQSRVSAAVIDRLLQHPDVKDGMRPKLRAARTALAGGTSHVLIGRYTEDVTLAELLAGSGGTYLSAEVTSDV